MKFTFDELKLARERGYSDDEIWNTLASEDEEIGLAKQRGYSLEEVASITSGQPIPESAPREFFSFEDAVSAIGTIPEALAVGVPAAFQKLVTGLEIPEKSEAIERELAFQERMQREQQDREASGKATSFGSAIRQAGPSLGFSVTSMGAAIPAGIGGAVAGGPAAKITGPAAAMAASGTVAYRMAGADMMYRAYKQLEERKGSPLTEEEKAEYYKIVLPIAQNYALWEAGPEAVSNAITIGVGKFVFGFGKGTANAVVNESIDAANKTLTRKVAEKGAAVAGGLGAEIASEGVTAVGQYPEEAKIRQLAATGEVSKGEPPDYPGGYFQAVKDVAPATIALYGIMGTAAGGAKALSLPFRREKSPEQIEEDNINLEADRLSRELSIGETDEETKGIAAALNVARDNLTVKKEVYTSLEPNDPAAQSLGLEIREMEREVAMLDTELRKRTGEPIATAEARQAELARGLAAPKTEEEQRMRYNELKQKAEGQVESERTLPDGTKVMVPATEGQFLSVEEGKEYRQLRQKFEPIKQPAEAPAAVSATITEAAPATEGQPDLTPQGRRMMTEKVPPVPVEERIGQVEIDNEGTKFFGNKRPKNFFVVDNETDEEFAYKAAYYPDKGYIIVNNAFIRKGENIQDIINHELGHYIYGDQDFRDSFQVFWESMSPEEKAFADNLINQFYNKETGAIQMEEKQVRAFMQLVQDANNQSKWKRVVDAVKNWINRIFGTNLQTADRGALAVLAAGIKRFKSGERIIREGDITPRRMAAEPRREEGIERQDKRSQVGGVEAIGAELNTPKQINAKVEEIVRNNIFSAAEVSDGNTTKAWNLIQKMVDSNPDSTKLVDTFNALTDETLGDKANETVKQTIAAAKVRNELFSYAMKLAGQGDLRMLQYLLNNRLQVIGTGGSLTTAGQVLQASFSMRNWIVVATESEKKAVAQVAAQQFFNTKNPTDEQIQKMLEIFNKVANVKIDQEKELAAELDKVGEATGIDVKGEVQKAINQATPKRDPWMVAIEILKKELGMPLAGFSIKPSDVTDKIKAALKPKLANFRKKMTKEGVNGLEKTFWKTMSDQEDKPGPLAEVDIAINRNLAAIVKDTLIKAGLKGEPPNTKMTIFEQVASILNNNKLTEERINSLDEKITEAISAKEGAEVAAAEEAGASADVFDEIEARYNGLRDAWAMAMSRQLDIPISDATLRRMVIAEAKEAGVDLNELANIADTDPAIARARKEKLAAAIVAKVANIEEATLKLREGVEGLRLMSFLPTNFKPLFDGLVGAIDSTISARNTKRKAAEALRTAKDEAGDPNKQARNQIKRLAKVQSDTQEWATPKKDRVREIVSNDLRNTPDLGRKEAWKSMLVGQLKEAGVTDTQAETLADLVWNQHEKNALTREMDALTTAVEKGPLKGIVDAILNTPLAEQQKPEWRQDVIRKYLTDAGVPSSKADNIAKLFDISLRKRFAEAQEKAAEKAAKSLEGGITPTSKRAMEKLRKAIRAQVLDPGKDVAKAFAEQMGWKGFTADQIARLNELDAIVNDKERTDAEVSASIEKINKIIDEVSLPPQAKDVIGSYYVGNILMRFTTFAIQQIDPLFYTTFNTAVESLKNVTNPSQFINIWRNYGIAIKNMIDETRYSFKNDILRSGKILDYMERQDRQIGRLWTEAQRKWERGDIKGAMKDGIFGYTALTFRTLKALDDGAYSLLTTANLPMYVDAALKRAKIPREKRRGVMRGILEAREMDIKNMVDKGMSRNDAVVIANEKMRGDIAETLTGMNIDAQEVIDSALNDALSRVGKTRFTTDINGKETEVKDLGTISSVFLKFYENVAKSVNAKEGSEAQKIFYRILFGFPLIPARIFNIAAGYTPLTIYRHFLTNRYSLTYGTALQRRQRIIEQAAGTLALLPLVLLRSNSLDEEDEKKRGFGVYITGQGPSRTFDKETRAQWDRRFDPYSIVIRAGNKSASLDARSSGPMAVMIYTLGAIDDWQNRRKMEGMKTTKDDWREAQEKAGIFTALYEIAGSVVLTTARRGPTTGLMQGLVDFRKYPDDPIAAIGADAAFSAMPAVPVIGTGIAKNLSDFLSQPIDNRTKEGAILSNIPIVGPVLGKPALNAYGQRIGELRVSEKLKKSFGLPFTVIAGDSEDDMKLTSLTLKFGDGPTPIRREEVENQIKAILSDEDWYAVAKTFGDNNRKRVLAAHSSLEKMNAKRFGDAMRSYTTQSKNLAIREARRRVRENR